MYFLYVHAVYVYVVVQIFQTSLILFFYLKENKNQTHSNIFKRKKTLNHKICTVIIL